MSWREKPYSKSVLPAPDEAALRVQGGYNSNPYSAGHAAAQAVPTPKALNGYSEGQYSEARNGVDGIAPVASKSSTGQNPNSRATASEDTAFYIAPLGYLKPGPYSRAHDGD